MPIVVGPPTEVPEPAGTARQYRCRGVDNTDPYNPIPGDWSAPATPSPPPTTKFHWFLSDPTDPTSGAQFDLINDWRPLVHQEDTIYYPIGRPTGVKSTDGGKGVSGLIEATTTTIPAWQRITALLQLSGTLLLQAPFGQYYVTCDGDATAYGKLETLGRTDYAQVRHLIKYFAVAAPAAG